MDFDAEVEVPAQVIDNLSIEPVYVPEEPFEKEKQKVNLAAKNGHDMTAYSIIANHSTPERIRLLNEPFEDPDGHASPPIVIASRMGHLNVVEMLVKKVRNDGLVFSFPISK